MNISNVLGHRLKEKPADVKLKSHELLIRGGFIRPVYSGIFSSLMPGLKVLRNIENIIREEMNNVGCQEVEMPLIQPKELWEESGRYSAINDELVRFKDRNEHDMVLAMTHEEAAVALARTEATSYKDYPFGIYQFAKKFRDEARPRGGLIRVREFTMKDAYTFHETQEDLENTYLKYAMAYDRIFARVGIPEVMAIKSDSGMMGGKIAHEYMLLTPDGEDTIITCDSCDYKANREVAISQIKAHNNDTNMLPISEIETPNAKTIEEVANFLNIELNGIIKTVVYKPVNDDPRTIVAMVRGDRSVNESKLSKILLAIPEFADDSAFENSGLVAGFASGYNAHNVRVIIDKELTQEINMVTGANKLNYHLQNFNVVRDLPNAEYYDIIDVQQDDICLKCGGHIKVNRGIEVGNIFQLGDKYTKSMGMTYMNQDAKLCTPIMGCYGIGIGRLMASVVEARHDERGPIWPISITPWKVALIILKPSEELLGKANILEQEFAKHNIELLIDDRKTSAGEKFADIDLLGIPLQIILSEKSLANGGVELKNKYDNTNNIIDFDNVVIDVMQIINSELEKLNTTANNSKGLPREEVTK
ncbi:MAG: proline--tRNA ligase [Alphaproteobacteria bacterium]|nr:proline--tRNA ligase [Alphaproteobacteria bacterium]